jgi:hypothetical protein
MIVVGKNWTPAISSDIASSPRANKKGLNPNVIPLISKICKKEKTPFNNVVEI